MLLEGEVAEAVDAMHHVMHHVMHYVMHYVMHHVMHCAMHCAVHYAMHLEGEVAEAVDRLVVLDEEGQHGELTARDALLDVVPQRARLPRDGRV